MGFHVTQRSIMTGFDTAFRRHCQRAHSHQPSQMPPLRPRRRGAPLLGLLALASAVLCLQPPAAAAFAAPPPAPAEGACWEQPKLRSLGPCVEADGPELNVTLQVGPRGGVFWLLVPATSTKKCTHNVPAALLFVWGLVCRPRGLTQLPAPRYQVDVVRYEPPPSPTDIATPPDLRDTCDGLVPPLRCALSIYQ